MFELSAALFGITVWALIFRAGIGLLERGNPKNTFGTALLLGVIFGFVAPYAISAFFLFGLILALLSLVALFRVLVQYYELGLLRAIGAIVLTEVGLYLARAAFIALYRSSPSLAKALVIALPAVVLVSWRVLRRREALGPESEVPKARALRWRGFRPKKKPSPAAPTQAKPAPAEAPVPAQAPAEDPAPTPAPASAAGVEKEREPNILR